MKSDIDISDIKYPLIIFYKENEGEWLFSWEKEPNKTYSDVFSNDDVKHIFTSLVFISETNNEINYIANLRKDRIVATKKVRVKFENIFKLNPPLTFDFLINNSSKAMAEYIRSAFGSKNTLYYIDKYQLRTIISSLIKLNEDYFNQIKRIINYDKNINTNINRNYITSTERDAIGIVLRINNLDNEINKMSKWNIEDISTPDFMKNLKSLNIREDISIIKDSRSFSNWQIKNEDIHSVCTLTNGINYVSIIYANRTKIESNIGVDLIYFDHINCSYVFVQYKRLTEEKGRYIYRPISDRNLNNELKAMERLEEKLSRDQSDYRFNDQIFYFKFCKERQEAYTKGLSNGFYMPKDYFLLINKLQKESNNTIIFSYDTITRYLTNTVFIELIKSGLIGTKTRDVALISNIIEESLSNKKSLILASSIPMIQQ